MSGHRGQFEDSLEVLRSAGEHRLHRPHSWWHLVLPSQVVAHGTGICLIAMIACLPSLESDGGCHECLVLRSLPQSERERLKKDGPAPDPKMTLI